MEHIKIDISEREIAAQERRAKRAEEAMESMRNRSPVNEFGVGPRVFSYDVSDAEDLARAFNEILDAAERESVEINRDAEHYLQQAAAEMADRAKSRDTDDGERSMARAVEAFNTLYDHDLTETEGWQFMSVLKKARGAEGSYREDDYTDDVAYAALAAEAAWEEQ